MSAYDFHQLSPDDFEVMCRDLMQADLGITLESFKTGKDGGIDFRYSKCGRNIVVQCKHYVRTGLSGLLRDLNREAVKVRALKPDRYILLTSVPLSPANKDSIANIIGLDVLQTDDIVGCDDLNNRLALHTEIEGRHYKLWLASRAVLDRVLHNAEVTQSDFKVRNVYRDIPRYVQSSAYPRALKTLDDERMVVVAGPPGVGKTTLANLLLYSYLEKGFQAVVIQRDIAEALRLFQDGKEQVFYYDDFMGATFLGERGFGSSGNDDRLLVEFIAIVRASPRARLVLTTREHILNQALERSERMRHSDVADHRVVLQMTDYNFAQRAKILYNHLYFSDLPPEYQDELLRDDFYLTIIRHQKYKPRLIEWLSTYRRVKDVHLANYRLFVSGLLENPAEIWRHAYERQISDAGRSLLLALFSLSGQGGLSALEKAFAGLHSVRAKRYGYHMQPSDFLVAFRELDGAFIKVASPHAITVLDPSVLDLMNSVVRDAPENALDLLSGAVTFHQIEQLWSFANAAQSPPVLAMLKSRGDAVAAALGPLVQGTRKVSLPKGGIAYFDATFERRVATVIDIADTLRNPQLLSVVEDAVARLKEEWRTEPPNLEDGADILRAFKRIDWHPLEALSAAILECRDKLIDGTKRGCALAHFHELIVALPGDELAELAVMSALQDGFEAYLHSSFNEELRDCKSSSDCEGLADELAAVAAMIGFDVEDLMGQIHELKSEFEENEAAYDDRQYEIRKEEARQKDDSVVSVREMFASLPFDRI